MQGKAALAIARKVQAALTPEETRAISERKQVVQEAYDEYLKGRALLDEAGYIDFTTGAAKTKESIGHFERALELDPNFALGYAGNAMAYDLLASVVGPSRDFFPKAKDAALRALSLDDTLADPALVLADVFFAYEWNFESGANEFKRLFELYPNHAMAHAWYASNIAHIDRKDEVLHHCTRALELDPLNTTVVGWTFNALMAARQYEKNVELARDDRLGS